MRIGIFGGSFDPVHSEHINLAVAAIKSLSLDKLIIVPAHQPPHKKGKTLTADAIRLELCKLAFSSVEKVTVSDYEIAKGGTGYTVDTCRYFQEEYPTAELFWLVGTDMLRDFPTWRNPEEILKMATLAVCARAEEKGWVGKEEREFFNRFQKNFAVIDYQGKEVSSTWIRVLAAAGEDISPYVGEKAAAYIKDKGLYEIKGAKEGLAMEKPERKAHSLRVAFLAASRAVSLGIPEQKAITAALFHDVAKNLTPDSPYLVGCERYDVPAPVRHQFQGAYVAREFFLVTDEDILNAIRYHTSGRENMSVLERLIFLSDMLESERDYEGVDYLRKLFWDKSDDLTVCIAQALKESLLFLKQKNAPVYELTQRAAEYYQKQIKDRL